MASRHIIGLTFGRNGFRDFPQFI